MVLGTLHAILQHSTHRIQLETVKGLTAKPDATGFLEENIRKETLDVEIGNGFLDRTSTSTTRAKKQGDTKPTSFRTAQQTLKAELKKVKAPYGMRENICKPDVG